MDNKDYEKAAKLIQDATRAVAFTGAGISVESGIPPFRGENGLWNKYDPATFDISYFREYPAHSWEVMRDIFYELFGQVKPNAAHYILAEMEAKNLIHGVITQNVDSLHQDAGNKTIHEFHGSLRKLICLNCGKGIKVEKVDLSVLPPRCSKCGGILKPNAVFFGESIPGHAHRAAFGEAEKADLFIIVGTTGEVAPANMIPRLARENGAKIIEINTEPSEYTDFVTHIFLQGKATAVLEQLMEAIQPRSHKKENPMAEDCLFCKIVKGEIPSEFIYEDEMCVVFRDINPHAPVHLLIVPKQHIRSVNDLTKGDAEIVAKMHMVARDMAKKEGVDKSGYKLLFNVEKGGGQVIFHLHLHLLGGWEEK